MSDGSYAEKLATLIEELPLDMKTKLRLTDVVHIIPRTTDRPRALLRVYDRLSRALAARRHPFAPQVLGLSLARWWAILHRQVLSPAQLDHLCKQHAAKDVRRALAACASECLTATSGGGA